MKKTLIIILTAVLLPLTVFAIQPQRGYRGFVDWSNTATLDLGFLSADNEPGDETEIFTGISTSHGYQFNDWLYVGGGIGFEYNLSRKEYGHPLMDNTGTTKLRCIVPIFAEGRLDAKWGRFTPYFSARIGANVANHGGIYFSPMVGYRFNWGRRSAINLGLGMTLFGYRYYYPSHILLPEGGIINGPLTHYQASDVRFSLRLGYEFQLP